MPETRKITIYFVDDEAAIRKAAKLALSDSGYDAECFASGEDCLHRLQCDGCDLLVTDVKMPDMDGFSLLEKILSIAPWTPVIMITGYGDISMAVQAMKLGAVDFIEKPFDRESFLDRIASVLEHKTTKDAHQGNNLTKAEMPILKMMLDGLENKEIAEITNRSIRTIEMHRGNIMNKFGAKNIVELVRKAAQITFAD